MVILTYYNVIICIYSAIYKLKAVVHKAWDVQHDEKLLKICLLGAALFALMTVPL